MRENLMKLPEEYKLLWKLSKTKRIDANILPYLAQAVKNQKKTLRKTKIDQLSSKLDQWGNNGKWGKSKIMELAKQIYAHKGVEDSDHGKWISVEIECIFQNKDCESDFVKFVRSKGWTKFVTIKDDGSIHVNNNDESPEENYDEDGNLLDSESHNPNAFGREIVVSFKFGQWDLIQEICKKLNSLKCEVNKTCGLHVHFDCRDLNSVKVTTLGKRIAYTVPALKQILPKSRADNKFCKIVINKHRSSNSNDRYAFVNLQSYEKHKTLEIRGHSGTTDSTKIINWIKILHLIMNTKSKSEILTVDALLSKFNFTEELINYISVRFAKFSQTEKNEVDDVMSDNNNNNFPVSA